MVERILEHREAGIDAEAAGGAVPRRAPQRPARSRAGAAQHPVRQVRRPQVPRGRAREGPALRPALGGEPARLAGGVSRPAVPAGHGPGQRTAGARAPARGSGFDFAALRGFPRPGARPPRTGRRSATCWPACAARTAWPAQVGAGARMVPAPPRAALRRGTRRAAAISSSSNSIAAALSVARALPHRTHARPSRARPATRPARRTWTRTT